MTSLLTIKALTITKQNTQADPPIIDRLQLNVNSGECLALVGESGSGKTMTSLAIMQLLPQHLLVDNKSQILYDGQDLLAYSEQAMRQIRGKHIAMIFQDAMSVFNPVFTLGNQMLETLKCHHQLSRKQAKDKIFTLLDEVGIPDPKRCYQSYPHQLSGGMLQRAMIAMALLSDPKVLIADEPTTALDVTIQAQVIQLLKKLQLKYQMAILFISHDLAVVSQLADHIIVMKQGKVVESNNAKAFFQSPQSDYSRKLINAIPSTQPQQRPDESKPTLLCTEHLKVYFPIRKGLFKRIKGYVKAVDDITLTIPKGETLALVGESGSGKTTSAKALLRLIPNSGGKIEFDQKDIAKLSARQFQPYRKDIQIIFQDPYAALNPRRRVVDSIAEGLITQKICASYQKAVNKVDELMTLVELNPDTKWRYPHEFSGGQRQRICIARAIGLSPKLLILDEPTSALDVSIQLQVLDLLIKLQQTQGFTYLLITHNLGVVAYMAHHIAVMHHSKIVESGTTADILTNPQDAYTQKLLKAIPTLEGSIQ